MSGSNYAGRLGRIGRMFSLKLEKDGESAGEALSRFLSGLELADLRRLEQQPAEEPRAIELQARFRELWHRWGHDPAERRRRAEVRGRLTPLLSTLSPEQFEEVRSNPAQLAKHANRGCALQE